MPRGPPWRRAPSRSATFAGHSSRPARSFSSPWRAMSAFLETRAAPSPDSAVPVVTGGVLGPAGAAPASTVRATLGGALVARATLGGALAARAYHVMMTQ